MTRPFASVQRPASSTEQGYGAEHRAWRKAVLARDPICLSCHAAPSTTADHIVPKDHGGARFALSNGQGLCARCHNAKTAKDINRRRSRKRPAEKHPGEV